MNNHKMRYILPLLFYFFPLIIFPQENIPTANTDSVYSFVDQPPEYPDGQAGLISYLASALLYPGQAIADSIEGKVYIGFVVEPDGSISNVKILRGIGGGCDEEAFRVINEMPAWKAGKLNGKRVRVSKTLPINFKLSPLPPDQTKIYIEADTLPSFVGGNEALSYYISESVSGVDPPDSTCESISVKVYFVVETDGSISNVTVKDTVGCGYDEIAMRIVQNMPKWKPGKINNTNVRFLLFLPVSFGVFQLVEYQPEFPGGMAKLYEYLADNVKYPIYAYRHGIQGRVYVRFVVEKDGSISNVAVLRGIGGGCDEEAVRVVQSMPKWKPGVQRGETVRVSFNLPIKFTLNNR